MDATVTLMQLNGQAVANGPKGVKVGSRITQNMLDEMPRAEWQQLAVKDDEVQKLVEAQISNFVSVFVSCRTVLQSIAFFVICFGIAFTSYCKLMVCFVSVTSYCKIL